MNKSGVRVITPKDRPFTGPSSEGWPGARKIDLDGDILYSGSDRQSTSTASPPPYISSFSIPRSISNTSTEVNVGEDLAGPPTPADPPPPPTPANSSQFDEWPCDPWQSPQHEDVEGVLSSPDFPATVVELSRSTFQIMRLYAAAQRRDMANIDRRFSTLSRSSSLTTDSGHHSVDETSLDLSVAPASEKTVSEKPKTEAKKRQFVTESCSPGTGEKFSANGELRSGNGCD